jgi:hypothetical protein
MTQPTPARPTPALERLECVAVFTDGDSHLVRITRDLVFQWGGTTDKNQAAAPVLESIRRAFAASLRGETE